MNSEANMGCRTIQEVDDAAVDLERLTKRLKPACLMVGGVKGHKRPTKAAVISAVLLWMDHQPPGVKESVIRDGIARLNAYLEGTDQPARKDEAGGQGVTTKVHRLDPPSESGKRVG